MELGYYKGTKVTGSEAYTSDAARFLKKNLNLGIKEFYEKFGVFGRFFRSCSLKVFDFLHGGRRHIGHHLSMI